VLDSRSNTFADDVAAITGKGVDVVLNSLAGEAMEMSLACLGPFGRFVELGKRDYVTNAHIGLRPFHRNLSYFGVDLDQLVGGRQQVGADLFREVIKLFENGTFRCLPYSVFAGEDVAEAFHLMQQSSHIGKIVVRPPAPRAVRAENRPWSVRADATHVVTGAFGGFGREAARWLADRGARHLVLLGRRGAESADARVLVTELAARGVHVFAEPCDVSDIRAVESVFRKVVAAMPPVAGVMHAAMVLDDAIAANLTAERMARVLAPKVKGAENLDMVTRGLDLDYFVLFSSVTTLIGNPGQGSYVAANAYMEGVARRRRSKGLPALAVGWGPISDVGVVAASDKLRGNLQRLTGVKGMTAREALDLLGQALAYPGAPELAVMTISPNDGGFSRTRLPVLRSPTYAAFVGDGGASDAASEALDIQALVRAGKTDAVRTAVADLAIRELAHVLHARPEDISRVRPLGDIGLDSLMSLEFVMNLEKALGIGISVAGAVGSLTIPALADEIVAQLHLGRDREDTAVADFVERHVATLEPASAGHAAPPRAAELPRDLAL